MHMGVVLKGSCTRRERWECISLKEDPSQNVNIPHGYFGKRMFF